MSDSLWPCERQCAWLPCPLLSPRVCSDSWPLSQWCHQTISSSVIPFSSSFLTLPASGPFLKSQFASCGQSIAVSASASVLPMNIQGWLPLGLTGLISLPSKGLSRVFSSTTVWKHQFFGIQPSLWFKLSHPYMITGKTITLMWTFLGKVMSLLFNTPSRFVKAFLPRSKCLLISWLQEPSMVILEPKKIKSNTVSISSPIYLPWHDGTRWYDLRFLNVDF